MDKRGKFIVIDGMDGSGKGTQIALLKAKLNNVVYFTREPGGTPLAEEIRVMLLRTDGPTRNPTSDLFLFFAGRASHVEDLIAPARIDGKHFLCDRYDSSTWAFQIYGEQRHELEGLFHAIRKNLSVEYLPDAYIFLDLPAEVAFERRAKDTQQEKSRFDIKSLEYHERVRDGFRQFGRAVLHDDSRVGPHRRQPAGRCRA